MDEQLQRKLLRQLRISNIFMGIVLFMVFVMFAVLGFLVWTVVTFTNDVKTRIDSIQAQTESTLNIRDDICGDDRLGGVVQNSSFCNDEPSN